MKRPGKLFASPTDWKKGCENFIHCQSILAIDSEVVAILTKLAEIEVKHKQRLFDLYLTIDSTPLKVEAFESRITAELMEGGFDPDKLLEQSMAAFKTAAGVLDFAMMLEAQAMDLYMRYVEKGEDPEVKKVLFKMANEEKAHLKSLGDLLDKNMDFK